MSGKYSETLYYEVNAKITSISITNESKIRNKKKRMLYPIKLKGILFDRTVVPVVSFITVKLLEYSVCSNVNLPTVQCYKDSV